MSGYSLPFTSSILIVIRALFVAISVAMWVSSTLTGPGAWGATSNTILGRFRTSPSGTLLLSLLVNTPQLFLSMSYMYMNRKCTILAGVLEWNNLAVSRKGLRVTDPIGHQRSTYSLQIPYRWSLPLVTLSGILHWLLSQSLFLVRIDFYDINRQQRMDTEESRMGCGMSGLSMLVLWVMLAILVAVALTMGRRTWKVRIPYAEGCSLVISAACHLDEEEMEEEAWLKKIQWGVVREDVGGTDDDESHCGLSSKEVKRPKVGKKYS